MTTGALVAVEQALDRLKGIRPYSVPALWTGFTGGRRAVNVDPSAFYKKVFRGIQRSRGEPKITGPAGEWTRKAVVYNMFVRTTTAFDHDRNGVIDLPLNSSGMRETGTFLKSIALLPYLKKLGVNTIHLLPITSIGKDGNKGTLGSPYAIRNPYRLDEGQSEPALGLDVDTECAALVEAAHLLGFRVVVEFVFRTAAKDSDWIKEHPEWFYWIRDEITPRDPGSTDETAFGSPLFSPAELVQIRRAVSEGEFDRLIPPHKVYRDFFREPPASESVSLEEGRYVGVCPDGTRVKIPGAFADWPPDDSQPPWGDVTYLRMYDHPDFNYMAYNTIRMYDARLKTGDHVNEQLWERIAGIIPHYQDKFGIDGVMIDMGHAMPMDLKRRMISSARGIDPEFAFWDEDFSIAQKNRDEGYNAVVGYLWMDEHHPARMKEFLRKCGSTGLPIPFFAGAETHNTPRAATRPGGKAFARWSWVINCFLPGVPFLHSGFELGEVVPINTGLDFLPEQVAALPPENLPLFSEHAYKWTERRDLVDHIAKVCAVRRKFASLVTDPDPERFRLLEDENPAILSFARPAPGRGGDLFVITNADMTRRQRCSIETGSRRKSCVDLLTGRHLAIRDGRIRKMLKPGECLVVHLI